MNSTVESNKPLALSSRWLWITFFTTFTISIVYAIITDHAWEDWYITYRVSKNLATGLGPVFTAGERIQAFTSPLGMLVPAFLSFITGNVSDELVLWLFRIISCALLGFSAVILLKVARTKGMSALATILLVGLFAVDAKIVDFSINGQETAFMMFFLTAFIYLLTVHDKHFTFKVGLTWAGLMWTRPDAFIYFGGIVLGYLIFKPESPNFSSRRDMVQRFGLAGIVTAAFYLPWFIWIWQYYGTPVAHTVTAKGLFMPAPNFDLFLRFLKFFFTAVKGTTGLTLLPTTHAYGGWPVGLILANKLLSIACAYYWCLPFARPQARAISLAVFLSHFYLSYVDLFVPIEGWYMTNVTLFTIFVISQIAQQGEDFVLNVRHRPDSVYCRGIKTTFYLLVVLVPILSLITTTGSAYQFKIQQEIIEKGNRTEVGLWLREHAASPKDTVFLECLGYVGFYSQLKMLDFPGLSSPEVVALRKQLKTDDYALIIESLHPDWLVLRPVEIEAIEKKMPGLISTYYKPAKIFDVLSKVDSFAYIPGRKYLEFDSRFVIFKKRDDQQNGKLL